MCHIAPKPPDPRQDRQHTYRGYDPLSDQTRKSEPGKVPTFVLGCLHASDRQVDEPGPSESLAHLQLCQASGPCNTASSSLRQNQRMLASAAHWQELARREWLSNDKFSKAQEFGSRHPCAHGDHLLYLRIGFDAG
jgi:hypothetical protein